MAYATVDDLKARFGSEEIISLSQSDDYVPGDDPPGAEDTATLEAALDDASSFIDSCLCRVVVLPIALASIPPVLKGICCDMARYVLADDAPNEQTTDRAKAAKNKLQMYCSGRLKLIDPTTGQPLPPPTSGDVFVTNTCAGKRSRVFSDARFAQHYSAGAIKDV